MKVCIQPYTIHRDQEYNVLLTQWKKAQQIWKCGWGVGVEHVKLSYSFLSPESMLYVVKYCHVGCCNNMPWLEDETIVPYPALQLVLISRRQHSDEQKQKSLPSQQL